MEQYTFTVRFPVLIDCFDMLRHYLLTLTTVWTRTTYVHRQEYRYDGIEQVDIRICSSFRLDAC